VAVLRTADDIAEADCPTFAAALAQYVLGN